MAICCLQETQLLVCTVGGCTAGLIEVREFLARFVDQTPDLADLEAAFADPTQGQHMQVCVTVLQYAMSILQGNLSILVALPG